MKFRGHESLNDLFLFSDEVDRFIDDALEKFNDRHVKLFDLPAYQRIFLFILTRSIKTYSSILVLCRSGYGQDASTLMRSLLENLVTAHYIIHDKDHADELARRFVAYKWVIFRRQLPEQEKNVRCGSDADKNAFLARKQLISDKIKRFKEDFHITSDRALITWSGKSVRDMARKVSRSLLEEYEQTFRICSRFSHPSILGDDEYLIQEDNKLTFSPQPSTIGIMSNLTNAVKYTLQFGSIADELFDLDIARDISRLQEQGDVLHRRVASQTNANDTTSSNRDASPSLQDSIVSFKRSAH